ncbi:hypothetical protein MHB46_20670 [Paenibacillus sp. FSL H7-0703]|uniref:hypothetical protein n=1 Tax=Paenibacillus sp. FSL H7-0703 TaxID=2921438 RepID=UPI0030FB8527
MKKWIFRYRYDMAAMMLMLIAIVAYLAPIYGQGQIVFSDIAFGATSHRYLEEITGVWNERWSTSTLFNAPRILYILPFYGLSLLFDESGPVLLKSFITGLLFVSAFSMYAFAKRLVSVYYSPSFTKTRIFAIMVGSLFYALNPWVIFRIQHIYLLCGYSLFPLMLRFFFSAVDPKFQIQQIKNYHPHKLYQRNWIDLFLLAAVFTVSAAAIHYFFFGMIYLGLFTMLLLIKLTWTHRKAGRTYLQPLYGNFLRKGIIFGVFFGLLSFYWLSLYVGSMLMDAQASQHNINVVDTLSLFSRNSSLYNVGYLLSYWWPMFSLSSLPSMFYVGGGFLLLLIGYAMVTRSYKNPIILIFSLLTLLFLVAATGTTFPSIAKWFVILVTKTPVIGSVFRDPNKFIGLIALNFGVLLTFGVIQFMEWFGSSPLQRVYKRLAVIIVVLCLGVYFAPLRTQFIEGYYKPVQVPEAYGQMAEKLTDPDRFDSKALYFPIADNMIQSYNGVATPKWNKGKTANEKATGDFQVYSSPKNTIFHHEGNDPGITYYMNFLQYVMDNGLSSRLGWLFSTFGVNQLVYHDEYVGQEKRQDFHLSQLEGQTGLKRTYQNGLFSIFNLDQTPPYMNILASKIVTPYGFSRLESYSHLPGFDFSRFGVLFSALKPELKTIQTINKGDYVEAASFNDLLLSQLPAEDYLRPFDAIEDGNAFLKWSKTFASTNDWLWYLSSQNIRNFPFDMEMDAGIAVTFASKKLDVAPYQMSSIDGKTVVDFDSMLRTETFFKPDNPQLFSVQANPREELNDVPTLHGEIMKGDPSNIWQVARSGLLEAKENNPYQFQITVSGRGTNKMHVKMRFYDKQMRELGVSYVVAPSEGYNFDSVKFYGEYVSPPGSYWMRMDLLTLQRPQQKNYWWIHDIQLRDLGQYSKPNTFTMHKKLDQPQTSHVYARVFMNKAGGKLQVTLPDKVVNIKTQDDGLNQFQWVDLGVHAFPKGDTSVTVNNLQGFNAVNQFAIVPTDQLDQLSFPVEQALKRGKLFFTLEAENDFNAEGNVQTERALPRLSMGRGISYQKGTLSRDVEVAKTGTYATAILANLPAGYHGSLTMKWTNEETGEVLTRTIHTGESYKRLPATSLSEKQVIETVPNQDGFAKKIIQIPGLLNDYGRVEFKNLFLTKGKYRLTLVLDSQVPSLSRFGDIHRMAAQEVTVMPGEDTKESLSTTDVGCVADIRPGQTNLSIKDEGLSIRYAPSYSCDWNIYASKKMKAEPLQEYAVQLDARSEQIGSRHMKVIFLNKASQVLQTSYIDEVEERDKEQWNHYDQIVKAPAGTALIQFQILAHAHKKQSGLFQMKQYSIIPYQAMITVDQFTLFEGTDMDTFFMAPHASESIQATRENSMERSFTLYNPTHEQVLIRETESPNPLWEFRLGSENQRARLSVNGVTTGFITNGNGNGKVVVILASAYRFGWVLFLIGILGGAACFLPYRRWKKRNLP